MFPKTHTSIPVEKGTQNLRKWKSKTNYKMTSASAKVVKKSRTKKRRQYDNEEIPSI